MSICPEAAGGLGRTGKGSFAETGSFFAGCRVGVQSNRLCTLTSMVEALLLHGYGFKEQWSCHCSFFAF